MKYLKHWTSEKIFESQVFNPEEIENLNKAKNLILSSKSPYLKFYDVTDATPEKVHQILKEFYQQLEDNYNYTSSIIGSELTEIVINFFGTSERFK